MIARGHLKSSIVTVGYTIQCILNDFNTRILISNVKWKNAQNFLNQIKYYLTEGSRLPELFGEFKNLDKWRTGWNAESITIGQRTRPYPEPTIQTAGVECEQTSQHYEKIIHDDIVARENIGTPDQIEKVKNYYRDSQSLLEPNGELIAIGTTWHYNDLYADLKKNEDYEKFICPAYDIVGGEPQIFFPNKFTWKSLMHKKKEMGPYLFSAQYLLNPYPDETQEFKDIWMQYYNVIPEGKYFIVTILDPSLGKKTSNFSALVTTAVNAKGDVYALEARRFKRALEQMPLEVMKSVQTYKSNVIAFEPFGFQQSLEEPIRRLLRANNLKTTVDLLPYRNQESKNTRIITNLVPKFSAGQIYLKEGMVDLVEELMKFAPQNRNNDDDIIDAFAWSNLYWDRKPTDEMEQKVQPYSLEWWLEQNKMSGLRDKDLLYEYRKREEYEQPVMVR
jgi:predicted phage terminase large subunit-like protein